MRVFWTALGPATHLDAHAEERVVFGAESRGQLMGVSAGSLERLCLTPKRAFFVPSERFGFANYHLLSPPFEKVEKQRGRERHRWASKSDV